MANAKRTNSTSRERYVWDPSKTLNTMEPIIKRSNFELENSGCPTKFMLPKIHQPF